MQGLIREQELVVFCKSKKKVKNSVKIEPICYQVLIKINVGDACRQKMVIHLESSKMIKKLSQNISDNFNIGIFKF